MYVGQYSEKTVTRELAVHSAERRLLKEPSNEKSIGFLVTPKF